MVSVLSRLRNPFKYTQLAQSPDTTTSRLHIPTFRFFNSKRHVILAAAALLVLFSLGAPFLTAPNTGRSHASGSQGWSFGPRPQTTVDAVDWSRFAYTQYATNAPYLCNSVMLFEILHRLGSRAERLLMYPSNFEISRAGTDDESKESLLLRKARDEYNVRLKPIEVVARNSDDRKFEGIAW